MALQTFAPAQAPNVGMGFQKRPRILSAAFGDGYIQRTPDGLNTKPRVYNLEWNPCSPDVADYIEGFLDAHGATIPFWWTSPRDVTPRKYVCPEWDRQEPQWNASSVTATFVEDFSLVI